MRMMILGLLIGHFAFAENDCQHDNNNFRCVQYVRNYDADTITFEIPSVHPLLGKKINVRVLGVDTPEIRTKDPCEKAKAKHAKDIVAKVLKSAKRIDLVNVKRGKYFRIVADVVIGEQSLTRYLLQEGLGVPYQGGRKQKVNWCLKSREIASQNQKVIP